MPVLRHAKKKLKQDKKRTLRNKATKQTYKDLVKKAIATKTADALSEAFSGIDKATKHQIMHKNKAARMKSSLSKIVSGGKVVVVNTKPTAKAKAKAKSIKIAAKKKSSKK